MSGKRRKLTLWRTAEEQGIRGMRKVKKIEENDVKENTLVIILIMRRNTKRIGEGERGECEYEYEGETEKEC